MFVITVVSAKRLLVPLVTTAVMNQRFFNVNWFVNKVVLVVSSPVAVLSVGFVTDFGLVRFVLWV